MMNWLFKKTREAGNGCEHYCLSQDNERISFHQVINLWQCDPVFRQQFSAILRNSEFKAYRWETPPVTRSNLNRPFEFILLRCDMLVRLPDENAFATHFTGDSSVVTFANLGGDAILVVPSHSENRKEDLSAYVHLAAFVRNAPEPHVDRLWQDVGLAMSKRVNSQPVWLSTAGMGVSWLHVRLDARPKYYGYRPYRDMNGDELG